MNNVKLKWIFFSFVEGSKILKDASSVSNKYETLTIKNQEAVSWSRQHVERISHHLSMGVLVPNVSNYQSLAKITSSMIPSSKSNIIFERCKRSPAQVGEVAWVLIIHEAGFQRKHLMQKENFTSLSLSVRVGRSMRIWETCKVYNDPDKVAEFLIRQTTSSPFTSVTCII